MILGAEVFLESRRDLVKGKRVGLITNPTGTDSHLRSLVDLFVEAPGIELVALYGPEHGVRGNTQAGEYVPFFTDPASGLPVFSLYGQSRKPPAGLLKRIDDFMREFDTSDEEKVPDEKMVGSVDVLIFDIQDVGTRIYTYVSTMAYAMQACAEQGIAFIVLDRPNPLNGLDMEGPILESPEFSSFVGLYPIPVRHGMTVGELGSMFNEEFMDKRVDLTVIPMKGWKRDMWFEQTGLPWVPPSPNMPSPETAEVYPGQVFIEGTNLSEGRGTTRPFELFGAPWIAGGRLSDVLNGLCLPGVLFREAWFTPVFSKFAGEICGGAQIHVMDRRSFRPFSTTLNILRTLMDLYRDRFEFHADYFDNIMGTRRIREALLNGRPVREIAAGCEADLADFAERRKPYLLYE